MTAHMETAPVGDPERLQERVPCNKLNTSEGTSSTPDFQVSIEDLNDCIEAAWAYERELARKQLRLRKFTLDLVVYRDALRDFGKAVWRGAV
ncbi:MAG: hypothetical protein ACREDO_05240 [Methyloceanibacter sp.]